MAIQFVSASMAVTMLVANLGTSFAVAASPMASFGVTTNVEARCQVSSAASSYRTIAAAIANAPSAVSVACNFMTPYEVSIDANFNSIGPTSLPKKTVSTSFTHSTQEERNFPDVLGLKNTNPSSMRRTASSTFASEFSLGAETRYIAGEMGSDLITVIVTY